MTLLRVENLTTLRGGPYSLALDGGEHLLIRGPSGCGKSLLMRAIADIDPPAGGEVFLAGAPSSAIAPTDWRRQVGYLAAESFWWADTVGEHFPHGVPAPERLGLPGEVSGLPVARLSTGERQRLSLLRLLANHPRVLLLDEPTANLDAVSAERVTALVMDTVAREGAALVWVGHGESRIQASAKAVLEMTPEGFLEVAP